VSGRPRAYNLTPIRPRGSVSSRPIDWRTRDLNTARPTRPGGWSAPAARPSRPPSERREFRGETRDRGREWSVPSGNRERARDNPPARSEPRARPERNDGNRGNSGREARGNSNGNARGNNNGGGHSSPPPRPSRPRRP
jgi:hypothetical protein